jgi:hypothetical protein
LRCASRDCDRVSKGDLDCNQKGGHFHQFVRLDLCVFWSRAQSRYDRDVEDRVKVFALNVRINVLFFVKRQLNDARQSDERDAILVVLLNLLSFELQLLRFCSYIYYQFVKFHKVLVSENELHYVGADLLIIFRVQCEVSSQISLIMLN